MSIWSSFAQIERLYETWMAYEVEPDSWIDLADSSNEKAKKLRILVDSGEGAEADAALDRSQVAELVGHLQSWLDGGTKVPSA